MKLTANFTVKLSNPFFLSGPVRDISFRINLDGFQDEVTLIRMERGHEYKIPEEEWPTYCVDKIIFSVTGEEDVALPAKYNPKIAEYFDKRIEKYVDHATLIVKKIIIFFKYELRNPLLNPDELDISGLNNPTWTDESGKEIDPYRRCFVVERIAGFAPEERYGSHPLGHKDLTRLKKYFEDTREIELYEELLSDAQAAILQKNPRRALLELAIACEIAVKQKFFMKKTPAGDVFEYLEDSRRLQVTVLELIDGAAKQAFGKSFKETHTSDYKNIEFLFRCRNKIAHRGEIQYKDEKGAIQKVDDKIIKKWWGSTLILLNWLKEI